MAGIFDLKIGEAVGKVGANILLLGVSGAAKRTGRAGLVAAGDVVGAHILVKAVGDIENVVGRAADLVMAVRADVVGAGMMGYGQTRCEHERGCQGSQAEIPPTAYVKGFHRRPLSNVWWFPPVG